jgi:hypothetical protein
VTQVMPVADALADFEQFLQAQREDVFGRINYRLLAAMLAGVYALNPPDEEMDDSSTCAFKYGRAAAHAAFMACPGLRADSPSEGQ